MLDINSKIIINPNLILKNRVIVPPMASQTADKKGHVTQKTHNHYKRLSQSNASMIMIEYTYVHLSGKSEPNQLGIDSNEKIEGLSLLAKTIENTGALAAIQLTHSGAKSERSSTDGRLLSPSGIAVPTKGAELEKPDISTIDDIELIKNSFLDAAIRANKAGFKIIEIHSAHGYGINQWLSPITNQRNDEYGGSIQNRSRILLEIITSIKKELPSLVLSVRIPGMDHLENGLTSDETIIISNLLKDAGVELINVSSGIGGWRRPRNRYGEGYLVEDAYLIQQNVNLPVIGVGGIKTAEYINKSLNEKKFSLAAVGRSILNDPSWGQKIGLY